MKDHHKEIIEIALDNMLNRERSFSICALDRLAETLGVNAGASAEYKFLRTLHCVNYSAMSTELKAQIPLMVMSCLSNHYDTSVMAKALWAVRAGEIKDLPETEDDCPTLRLVNRT